MHDYPTAIVMMLENIMFELFLINGEGPAPALNGPGKKKKKKNLKIECIGNVDMA